MPRPPRLDIGGNYYHILNRANARVQISSPTESLHALFIEEERKKKAIRTPPKLSNTPENL